MLQLTNFLSSLAASVVRQLKELRENLQNITQVLNSEIRQIKDEMRSTGRKKPCPVFVDSLDNYTTPTNELIPAGSEFITNGGSKLYICRASYQDNSTPGKYHAGRKSCHFPWGEVEHSNTTAFQVLIQNNSTVQWVYSISVPVNSVEGGKTTGKEPLHVIRCQYKQGNETAWIPGWYQKTVGPYTGYGWRKIQCGENQREFLICV